MVYNSNKAKQTDSVHGVRLVVSPMLNFTTRQTPHTLRLFAALYEENRESMATKFNCECGEVCRTNLYEGNDVHLLVKEALTDTTDSKNTESVLSEIVQCSDVVVICRKCKNLHVIDSEYKVSTYQNTKQSKWSVWRQDDNANEICMATGLGKAGAECLMKEFELKGHKQIYWVSEA